MRGEAGATALRVAIAGVLGCIGVSVLLLYAAPADLRGVWGIDRAGARIYLDAAGLSFDIAPLDRDMFVWAFRALLVLSWISWLVVVAAAFGGARPGRRAGAAVVAVAAIVLAVVGPPVLSTDALAYVSYGRILYAHGLNPYEHGQAALAAAGDPSAAYLFAPVLMPYGPLWPALMAVLGPVASMAGLFGEILVHKLLAAAGLITAATAAARAADGWTPGRGPLTLLAVGLNPLLLLETAVGGHNDILPIALLAIASACSVSDRPRAGGVAFGLAIAAKATALGALPLFLFDRWVHANRASRVRDVIWSAALAIGPVIGLSYLFGGPAVVFGAASHRVEMLSPTGLAAGLGPALMAAALAYGLWIIRRSGPHARGIWTTAWVIVAIGIVIAGTTLRFPWYLAWPLVPALTNWNERHRILITAVAVCCVLATWLYTVGP